MLGDGLACYDLDHVIATDGTLHLAAAAVLREVREPVWVERSMSGRGLHVFVYGAGDSYQGSHVSYYSRSRFIVVTGRRYQSRLLTTAARSRS